MDGKFGIAHQLCGLSILMQVLVGMEVIRSSMAVMWHMGSDQQKRWFRVLHGGELKAIQMTLESLVSKLKNERVKWFSDNQNVVHILQIGSKKLQLQEEALAVFSIALQNLISSNRARVDPTCRESGGGLS